MMRIRNVGNMSAKQKYQKCKNPLKHDILKDFYLINCDPEGIRTPNRQSRNLIFYPVELLGLFKILLY